MARFIAVHTLPLTREQAQTHSHRATQFPPGFMWRQTYGDFSNEGFSCDWEAPGKEALEQTFNKSLKLEIQRLMLNTRQNFY